MNLIVVTNYSTLAAFGKVLKTSCIIADRYAHGMSVVYSENEDGSQGMPYQPQRFPLGTWQIIAAEASQAPLLAPFFIRTNAHQFVPVWELDALGKYKCATGETVDDWGYGIHFDALYEATDGCLHLYSAEDATWLAGNIIASQKDGEAVQLTVA